MAMKKAFKKAIKIIAIIVGGIFIIVAVFIAVVVYNLHQKVATKTSVNLYPEIIEQLQQSSTLYSFFPVKIALDADRNVFYYVPKFFQRGDTICLRQKLSQEKFHQIVKQLEASGRIEISDFGDMTKPNCYPKYGTSSEQDVTTLPEGFRIFLFESDLEEIKKKWNHHFLGFTAVSSEKCEVIYYAHQF